VALYQEMEAEDIKNGKVKVSQKPKTAKKFPTLKGFFN
jgi:hypothetical protein